MEAHSQYLLKWLAHTVQRRGVKIGTMVWLCGPQGTGKGWLFKFMHYILGKGYVQLASLDHLTGKFNQHLMARLLVTVDEACFNGSTAQADAIKNRVTEQDMLVEGESSWV